VKAVPLSRTPSRAKTYADQVRSGVVLSVKNLALFIEEQEAENGRLRESLTNIAGYTIDTVARAEACAALSEAGNSNASSEPAE
jgi:hypothetical protein